MRCANVRSGHAAKGHQLSDGRVFARGAYESSYKFEEHRKQILDDIYVTFHQSMMKLAQLARQGVNQLKAAAILHRDDALSEFYPASDKDEPVGLQHTVFCICCLFGVPEALLPCGHMLCRECVEAYGHRKAQALIEVMECPLEINQTTESQPHVIYTRPESAGVRVLALHKYDHHESPVISKLTSLQWRCTKHHPDRGLEVDREGIGRKTAYPNVVRHDHRRRVLWFS